MRGRIVIKWEWEGRPITQGEEEREASEEEGQLQKGGTALATLEAEILQVM